MAPLRRGYNKKSFLFCDANFVNWHWRKEAKRKPFMGAEIIILRK
jgi:hypothetical protein